MNHKLVLIVDDDEDIRIQLKVALEAEGYSTLSAGNGKDALELLKNTPLDSLPNCMILDLMMPVMDGITLIDTIHRDHHASLGKIKIIIATAKGKNLDTTPMEKVFQRIRKPFDLDELYGVIEKSFYSEN